MINELMPDRSSSSPAFRIVFGLLLGASVLLVWLPKYLPLTDYPEHLLVIQVLAHHRDASSRYFQDYSVQLRNVPYISVYLLGMFLNRIMPIFAVGKTILSLYVIFTPLSLLAYVRSTSNASPWSSLFSFALLFNLFYYLGSLNFLVSIPLAFFTLALILDLLNRPDGPVNNSAALRVSPVPSWRPFGLALLSVAVFYAHFVSYAAVILVATGLIMTARARRRPVAWVVCSLIPSMACAVYTITEEHAVAAAEFQMSWLPFSSRLFDLLQPFLIYRDDYFHHLVVDWFGLPLIVLVVTWLVISIAWRVRESVLSKERPAEESRGRAGESWIVLLFFLLAALVFPSQIPSASFAHRISILVLLSVVGILPRALGERTLTKASLVAVALFALSVTGGWAVEFNREMKPFLSAVAQMQPDARVLPLIQNLHSAHLHTYPFLHIMNYYHLEKGGSNPYLLFRNMPQIPVHYRFLARLPSVGSFEPELFNWDLHHDRYQYFLAREPGPRVMGQLRTHSRLLFESQGWYLFEPLK